MTSQSPAHVALESEDAPAVEGQDQVLLPSKKSLSPLCSILASETSYLRGWSRTNFLSARQSLQQHRRVAPPSERSLLSPCSTSGSERSDLGDLWRTSFLTVCLWQILDQGLLSPALSDRWGGRGALAPAAPSSRLNEASELVPVDGEDLRLAEVAEVRRRVDDELLGCLCRLCLGHQEAARCLAR